MRRKFELDFKLRIVRRYFEDIIGIDALSSETSIDRSLIRKWVKFYELYGVSGLARTRNSYYPVSFKLKVIKFVAQGMSIKEAARKFNIAAESSIIKWQRDYEKSGNLGLENRPRGRPKTMSNYHKIKRKYLQLYLNEFIYKLNRRYFGDSLFERLIIANITGL